MSLIIPYKVPSKGLGVARESKPAGLSNSDHLSSFVLFSYPTLVEKYYPVKTDKEYETTSNESSKNDTILLRK